MYFTRLKNMSGSSLIELEQVSKEEQENVRGGSCSYTQGGNTVSLPSGTSIPEGNGAYVCEESTWVYYRTT
jgi:hypothetical protein